MGGAFAGHLAQGPARQSGANPQGQRPRPRVAESRKAPKPDALAQERAEEASASYGEDASVQSEDAPKARPVPSRQKRKKKKSKKKKSSKKQKSTEVEEDLAEAEKPKKKRKPLSPSVKVFLEPYDEDEEEEEEEEAEEYEEEDDDYLDIPELEDMTIGDDHVSMPANMHLQDELDQLAASMPLIPQSLIFTDPSLAQSTFGQNAAIASAPGMPKSPYSVLSGNPRANAPYTAITSVPSAVQYQTLFGQQYGGLSGAPQPSASATLGSGRYPATSQYAIGSSSTGPLSAQGGSLSGKYGPAYAVPSMTQALGGGLAPSASGRFASPQPRQPQVPRRQNPSGPFPTQRGQRLSQSVPSPKSPPSSGMFDSPASSIQDGMRKADRKHGHARLIIIIVAIVVLLGIGGTLGFLFYTGQIQMPGTEQQASNQPSGGSVTGSNAQTQSNAQSSQNTATSSSSDGASAQGDAGDVVYQYTAITTSGVAYSVEETVTYNEQGYCQTSVMRMKFPDADSAKSFTDNLARDYKSSFTLDSLEGTDAVVTIDNSSLHLNREEYENALRYSVEDLVILKK